MKILIMVKEQIFRGYSFFRQWKNLKPAPYGSKVVNHKIAKGTPLDRLHRTNEQVIRPSSINCSRKKMSRIQPCAALQQ
jgi:hypothetical protein